MQMSDMQMTLIKSSNKKFSSGISIRTNEFRILNAPLVLFTLLSQYLSPNQYIYLPLCLYYRLCFMH